MEPVSDLSLSTRGLEFAHISDLHLPHEPHLTWAQRLSKRQLSAWSWRKRRLVQRPEVLEALRVDLRVQRASHVLVTGDITNFSLPAEFRGAAAWLRSISAHSRVSLVPGNHDALMPLETAEGMGLWSEWTGGASEWPYVVSTDAAAVIGVCTATPTLPLLATGQVGAEQLERLEDILQREGRAGRTRVVLMHHPIVDGAVRSRKALTDRIAMRAVLQRAGAELVLHGHAREARLESVPGPRQPIPVLCVPSSSALPNPHDAAARWNLLSLPEAGEPRWARVKVREWSLAAGGFKDAASYLLRLPDME